jgi:hypothetical protein
MLGSHIIALICNSKWWIRASEWSWEFKLCIHVSGHGFGNLNGLVHQEWIWKSILMDS